LLINFLREILYLFNGKALIIRECEITKCGNKTLDARLWLEPYNKKKHAQNKIMQGIHDFLWPPLTFCENHDTDNCHQNQYGCYLERQEIFGEQNLPQMFC